jgi:branched-chain amino acid transport system ATP-binding protein
VIEILDLDVYYGAVHALKGVSLKADAGEIVTLIGANGAGKTTLLRAISGLVPARAGYVAFEGRNITKMPAHEIVGLGISHAPEGRMVFANLSVDVNLELGAYLRRDRAGILEDRERVFRSRAASSRCSRSAAR